MLMPYSDIIRLSSMSEISLSICILMFSMSCDTITDIVCTYSVFVSVALSNLCINSKWLPDKLSNKTSDYEDKLIFKKLN